MTKRSFSDILWLALVYAKSDRTAFIDAYRGDTSEKVVRDAISEIKDFEALQIKLFGTNKTEMDSTIEKMKSVNIIKAIAQGVDIEGLFSDKGKSRKSMKDHR